MPGWRTGPIRRTESPLGMLDLDDIGPKIAQDLRCRWPHDNGSEVDHTNPGQRSRGLASLAFASVIEPLPCGKILQLIRYIENKFGTA